MDEIVILSLNLQNVFVITSIFQCSYFVRFPIPQKYYSAYKVPKHQTSNKGSTTVNHTLPHLQLQGRPSTNLNLYIKLPQHC